ncbi:MULTISPECIES: trypsin-like peptidase domain-containing protein [unclassified Streptomyces]|uniref:trypsin-like peptidase domain-containing protein n=1 Tax=unclassified Streptomyces TaxID=2593676 RepID=UPI002E2AF6C6|nr:trypsin-like peptidase domain-containing protein [Streptomyces sp. NBC_00334]
MNEGKPTKAKWWSRPRSSEDASDAPDALGGDFELERPRPAPGTDPGDREADGGDFELDRPVPPRAGDAGDYELDRPLTPGADGTPGGETAAERPRPLHEPDPYSTPPYGEPGPWAPAPPVQHPAATPPHGTATAASPTPTPPVPTVPVPASPVPASPVPTVPVPTPPVPTVPAQTVSDPAAPRSASAPAGAVPDPAFADAPPPAPPTGHPTPSPAYDTASHTAAAAAAAPAVPAPGVSSDPSHAGAPLSDPSSAGVPGPWAGAAADPWGRYDPWAASAAASLQHDDAGGRRPEQRRGRATRTLVGGALLIALVSGGIGGAVGAYLERNGGVGTVELPQAGHEAAERAPDTVAGIAARALPSVVTLHVSGSEAAGTGTGFVLDGRGHILTNNHVVEPAGSGGEITVTFNSGDTAEATVVGRDSGYDLAVVQVKGVSGLTPLPLGNSDNVRVGDPVVAIGAPFDLAGTVTSGIISARERPITAGGEEGDGSDVSYVDALQTDAPINPGNSGGPLLDARGRAIGINSAIRSADSGGAESDGGQAGSIGLGFAIPINQGKRVAEELINTGKATHPVIGVTLDMSYAGDGARVGDKGGDGGPAVTTGGPGALAGIRPGDVITAVDGQRVHSGEELIVKTRAHRPGDRLELTLERGGKETKVSLVLGSSGGG